MKTYDIVKDVEGKLYIVDSVFIGKHESKQACCFRLDNRHYYTFDENDLVLWVDCDKCGIGR